MDMDADAFPKRTEEPRCVVTLVLSLAPRSLVETILELPVGATVADALAHARSRLPEPALGPLLEWSVWGRRALPAQVLQEGDRLEGTRALRVDPKVARRERFTRQGARGAGLFSKRQRSPKSRSARDDISE